MLDQSFCYITVKLLFMSSHRKKISLADIAREAGLSRNAVSLALRNDRSIPVSTRERVKGIARRLGYSRNPYVSEIMARHRSHGNAGHQGTFALFNGNFDPEAFIRHPTIPLYVAGAKRRANEWGYRLDSFWLHDPTMRGERLRNILDSRGICGVLVVGLMNQNRLPEQFRPVLESFPCVVTGVRTRQPALNFACVDHHILALRAVEKAISLGYRRPGLVLDRQIEDLIEHRFSAGYRVGQQNLPPDARLEPHLDSVEAETAFEAFRHWFQRERPDVLLILYNEVRDWLEKLKVRVPEDMGLIQLEWRATHPEIAGMNQHNDLTGEAAVEMLLALIHQNHSGIPAFPRATLIGPTWVNGPSVMNP